MAQYLWFIMFVGAAIFVLTALHFDDKKKNGYFHSGTVVPEG